MIYTNDKTTKPKMLGKAVALTAMLALSSYASAATVSLSSLTANPANTFVSGGLTFDMFAISNQGSSITLDFNEITVSDLIDDTVNGAGIQIDITNGMLDLVALETANLLFSYRVTATQSLTSARLAFGGCTSDNPATGCTGISKSGSGSVSIDENVQYNANAVNNVIDNGSSVFSEKNAIPVAPSHANADVTSFISLAGGNAFANLTSFEDRYQVASAAVPLPAGIWLFGSGILALFGFNRKTG